MKLEIKHLSAYLPYDLKIGTCHSHNEKRLYSTMKITNDYGLSNSIETLIYGKTKNGEYIKPILRPLSELDNEFNTPESLQGCCYSYVQILFSKHYDVFGLIDKNLAININDVNSVEA